MNLRDAVAKTAIAVAPVTRWVGSGLLGPRPAPDLARTVLVIGSIDREQQKDFLTRLRFYAPEMSAQFLHEIPAAAYRSRVPVAYLSNERYCKEPQAKRLRIIRRLLQEQTGVFNLDSRNFAQDGWHWCTLTQYAQWLGSGQRVATASAAERLRQALFNLRNLNLPQAYVFGTGPTLEKAQERDWSDGYRIVCNTIVRDVTLWRHLDPHVVVAGDAIYHYGHTEFAEAFRRDLRARLDESSAIFIYPDLFDPIVRRALPKRLADRLFPASVGKHKALNRLLETGQIPPFGNVLALLQIPIACALSRKVGLWGFDGRAPTDKFFWSNSPKHSYPEYFDQLVRAHPAFFHHFVPAKDPGKYVRNVHGEELDQALSVLEHDGWEFVMLHPSWTEMLAKRYRPSK